MNWLGFIYYGLGAILMIILIGIIIRAVLDAIELLIGK